MEIIRIMALSIESQWKKHWIWFKAILLGLETSREQRLLAQNGWKLYCLGLCKYKISNKSWCDTQGDPFLAKKMDCKTVAPFFKRLYFKFLKGQVNSFIALSILSQNDSPNKNDIIYRYLLVFIHVFVGDNFVYAI